MEEASFLVAMQRIVGGVEIERDLLGRLAMRLKKQVDEQPLDGGRIMTDLMIAGRDRPRQLEPVERRLAGDRRAIRPLRLQLAGQDRHQGIVAQVVVVVEVLVAERQPEDPLANERRHAVLDQLGLAPVIEARREPLHQLDCPVGRAQQQRARVRRDRPAVERRHHRAAFDACKLQRTCATLCRHRGLSPPSLKSFSQNNFR